MRQIKIQTICISLLMIVLVGCVEKTTTISLQRVAVIGASVTAGWGVNTPPIPGDLGAYPVTMKHIMEGMIEAPHEAVTFCGNMMFFRRPIVAGKELIKQVLEHEPTLVVGIDFMFWYAYGTPDMGDDIVTFRLNMFEQGLALLDTIDAPIIVGDIPDMHAAIGKMLFSHQVPKESTIELLNTRLREWAAERPRVSVINVHDLVEDLMNDDQINISHYTWPAGSQSKLLQKDMLHPTLEGTVAISLLMVDFIGEDGLQTDPKLVMKEAAAAARDN